MVADALGEPVEEAGGDRCLRRVADSECQKPVQAVVVLDEVSQGQLLDVDLRYLSDELTNGRDAVLADLVLRVVHVPERLVAVALAQPATVRLVNRSVRSPIPQEAVDHDLGDAGTLEVPDELRKVREVRVVMRPGREAEACLPDLLCGLYRRLRDRGVVGFDEADVCARLRRFGGPWAALLADAGLHVLVRRSVRTGDIVMTDVSGRYCRGLAGAESVGNTHGSAFR